MQMITASRLLGALFALANPAASLAQDSAPGAAEESAPGEEVRNLSGGPPEISDELLARAKAAAITGRARQGSAETDAYSRRLRETLGLTEDGTNENGATPPDQHQIASTTIAFVSSSVPLPVLRAYAEQLEIVGGHFVFQGVPGGMERISPFVGYSMDILKVDPSCQGSSCKMRDVGILIDPLLFRTLSIERVPGFAVVNTDIFQSYCQRQDEAPSVAAVSFGDVHLIGHLEELDRLGDPHADLVLTAFIREGETP